MNYPIVFDSDERLFVGLGMAILENATDVKIKKVINGEYTLSLMLPRSDPKWEYIKEENFIYVDGQAFRIRKFEEIRDTTGKFVSNIQCEHVCYDLNDVRHLPKMRDIVNVTPREVFLTGFTNSDGEFVEGVLKDTDFSFESEDVGSTDLFLSKTTPRAVLNEFINALDCEVEFDNYTIRVVKRIGSDNSGVIFQPGTNLTEIKRTTDSSGLCTRLYPYGAEYLDITSVNGGIAYIDSPLIDNYDYPHEDFRDYSDIDNPTDLMARGLEEWSIEEHDGIDKPKVTYELSVVELKKIPEFAQNQAFNLGDGIKVRDKMLGIDINARITEYEYYPYEPKRSSVVLANFKDTIGGVFEEIQKSQNIIKRITNKRGDVEDQYIESVRETKSVLFNEALVKKTVMHDYANMWVDDVDNPTSVVALVDGMFAIANERGEDGNWNWRTVVDGNGLIADSVVSNWVYAGEIDASQISAGTINTSLITICSEDGKMVISSDSINMTATDGTGLTISPENGLVYNHTVDEDGTPLVSTVVNREGCGKMYSDGSDTTYFKEYIDKLYFDTMGGSSSDPYYFYIDLCEPQWQNLELDSIHVIITLAEDLSFCTPLGGKIGDIRSYDCSLRSIEYYDGDKSKGVTLEIHSIKSYVSSVSNDTPSFNTKAVKFNLLVLAQ